MMNSVDLIVIGAGPAGYEAAIHAAQSGMQVVLIEKDQIGGTCLNRGCIPTKSLLYQAHQIHQASQWAEVEVQAEVLNETRKATLERLRGGIAQLIKANGIELMQGEARILDEHRVQVNDEILKARFILIATGSQVSLPPIEGIEHALTSDQVLEFDRPIPKRVLLIGAGVIGLEFADLYLDLGAQVIILEATLRPLAQADREIGQNLQMILKRRGAEIHCGIQITRVEAQAVDYIEKDQPKRAEGDLVIVAAGRQSVLCASELELKTERGRLCSTSQMQTNIPTIYAAGDVTSPLQLAHLASAQAINAVDEMLGKNPQFDLNCVPSCLYTHPEAAWVGLSEDQAKAEGRAFMIGKASTLANSKAVIEQAPRGFVKLIADAATRVLLGGVIVGAHASDWIGTVALAVSKGLTIDACQRLITAHPTWSETLHEALMDFDHHAIHTIYRR